MRITYVLIVVLALVVAGGGVYLFRPTPEVSKALDQQSPMTSPVDNTEPWPPKPSGLPFYPENKVVRVTLKTSLGDIRLALDGPRAPLTVGSFVHLAQENFYDGTVFHRVIPGFVIQGGDPLSRDPSKRDQWGRGGPNYKLRDEINERRHTYGVVSMANSGPHTNGSQFFIVVAPQLEQLDGSYTTFGIVEEGMDVVEAITQGATDDRDRPLDPVVIEDVIVGDGISDALQVE